MGNENPAAGEHQYSGNCAAAEYSTWNIGGDDGIQESMGTAEYSTWNIEAAEDSKPLNIPRGIFDI
jgi:hypothetical protein